MSQNFLNGPETTINVTTIARLVQTEFLKLQRFFSKKNVGKEYEQMNNNRKPVFFLKKSKNIGKKFPTKKVEKQQ